MDGVEHEFYTLSLLNSDSIFYWVVLLTGLWVRISKNVHQCNQNMAGLENLEPNKSDKQNQWFWFSDFYFYFGLGCGHSTSISACGVWGIRVGIQVSRREFHTHIHLD